MADNVVSGQFPLSDTPSFTPSDDQPQAPPASMTGAGVDPNLQSEIDQTRKLMEEQLKAHEQYRAEEQRNMQMRDEAMKDVQEQLKIQPKEDAQIPQLTPLNEQSQEGLNHANQLGNVWPAVVGLGMAVAGMLGKHHGGIGSQYFWGSFLSAYAKGNTERQKQARESWWKQVEYEHQVNQERLANYRAALQDAKYNNQLNTQNRMALLNTYATLYGDAKASALSSAQDLKGTQTYLNQLRQAQDRYLKEFIKTNSALDFYSKSSTGKEYLTAAYSRYFEKTGKMPATEADQLQALSDYKFSTWSQDQFKLGPVDPATGKQTLVPKFPQGPGAQFAPKDPEAAKSALDQGMSNLQKGQQGTEDKLNKSIEDMPNMF